MKAVLLSIRPKYCELIAEGKKTVEVRKTWPKLELPFKCYIYCTMGDSHFDNGDRFCLYTPPHDTPVQANGYLIGEFVCDVVCAVLVHPDVFAGKPLFYTKAIEDACLTQAEVEAYSGGKDVAGLHITQLEIYDRPKPLGLLHKPCENALDCESCAMHSTYTGRCGNKALWISRPPQSWCYVEEMTDE